MKIFVLGLDGATFSIIDPMIEKGLLPNFKKLYENGASGDLLSTTPPHTAPGWVSAITGVNPGKHGIYQFWDTQADSYIGKFMGSSDIAVPTLWEILNLHNISTGIINVPMTHPPKKLDGYTITWPLSKTLRYSYPNDLIGKIADAGGHFLPDLFGMFEGDLSYINKAKKITIQRIKTIKYLIRNHPVDFFMTVFPEIDRISHYYWKYSVDISSDIKLRNAIHDIYIETDKIIGEIFGILPEDCAFFVLSDHGFGKGNINFHVNTYLKEMGYLSVKKSSKISKNEEKSVYKLNDGGWFNYFDNDKLYEVDWTKTVAYISAPGSYGININLKKRQIHGIVDIKNKRALEKKISEDLLKIKDPNSGALLFKDIVSREQVYKGDCTKYAPDLILFPNNYGIMVHHQLTKNTLFSEPEQNGMHREKGIFMACGKNIRKCTILNAKLEDFLPTILYLMGLDVPEYLDGNVLDIFSESPNLSNVSKKIHHDLVIKNVSRGNSYSDKEKNTIQEKLKSLGYL